jgi:SAM-dependent methyltransferase
VGLYNDRILPRVVDLALRGPEIEQTRQRATEGLGGDVLEVGFGSGRNVPHYPSDVTRVQAVDPATRGREMAAERLAASAVPVEFVGLDGQDLPLPDASVDHVLCTWTLCTIPDPGKALREVRRVLRPGGTLHFAEHGLAADPKVVKWQHRLTPLQRRLAGGCHLDRPIDDLITDSGFVLTRLERRTLPGPKVLTSLYEGVATPA